MSETRKDRDHRIQWSWTNDTTGVRRPDRAACACGKWETSEGSQLEARYLWATHVIEELREEVETLLAERDALYEGLADAESRMRTGAEVAWSVVSEVSR